MMIRHLLSSTTDNKAEEGSNEKERRYRLYRDL